MKKVFELLIIAAPLTGCGYNSDYNQANAETRSRLHEWANVISVLAQWDIKVDQFDSTQSILSQYKDTQLFASLHEEFMKQDYWGRPYVWIVSGDEDKKTILIGSCGKKGIWEGGENDDLYVTVELSATGGVPVIHEKPAPYHWHWWGPRF
jgi:hypothetical protein